MVHTLAEKYEGREIPIIRTLFVCSVVLTFLYGYFLFSSVMDALLRKEFEKAAVSTESAIAEIETTYMQRSATIDRDTAYGLGFVDAPTPKYIAAIPRTEGLSFNR